MDRPVDGLGALAAVLEELSDIVEGRPLGGVVAGNSSNGSRNDSVLKRTPLGCC